MTKEVEPRADAGGALADERELPINMLVDAVIKLNGLLDRYWEGNNSKTHIIAMCGAQQECKQALDVLARTPTLPAAGEVREAAAEAIYNLMPFDGDAHHLTKPPWIPHGNSLKQDEARRYADAALALPPASPAPQGEDMTELAERIRDACEAKGYDIKLREFSPRTDIGKRNFIERSEELANYLNANRAAAPAGTVREALRDACKQLIEFGGDGREFGDCDAVQAAILDQIDAALVVPSRDLIVECAKIASVEAFAARLAVRSARGPGDRSKALGAEDAAQRIEKAIRALASSPLARKG